MHFLFRCPDEGGVSELLQESLIIVVLTLNKSFDTILNKPFFEIDQ